MRPFYATTNFIKRFLQIYTVMKPGHIVNIEIWDGYSGTVKIIKKSKDKWLIEVVDVCMCYSSQAQIEQGEQAWVRRRDIYHVSKLQNKIRF